MPDIGGLLADIQNNPPQTEEDLTGILGANGYELAPIAGAEDAMPPMGDMPEMEEEIAMPEELGLEGAEEGIEEGGPVLDISEMMSPGPSGRRQLADRTRTAARNALASETEGGVV